MTWWIANEVGGIFECTFEKLNQIQPAPYQVFKNFTDKPVDKVIGSIEKLRLLPWPTRQQYWEKGGWGESKRELDLNYFCLNRTKQEKLFF